MIATHNIKLKSDELECTIQSWEGDHLLLHSKTKVQSANAWVHKVMFLPLNLRITASIMVCLDGG